jgi:hypothetical protein
MSKHEEHLANDCLDRMIPCSRGCGKDVVARDLNEHLVDLCDLRFVDCPAGCGVRTCVRDTQFHLREVSGPSQAVAVVSILALRPFSVPMCWLPGCCATNLN